MEGYRPPMEEILRAEQSMNGEQRRMSQERETENRVRLELAKELFGKKFHGSEDVKQIFGKELDETELPAIPYSQQELKEAAKRGDFLNLRIDSLSQGKPFTIENLRNFQTAKGQKTFSSGDDVQWAIEHNLSSFTKETPRKEWKLIHVEALPGTEHLSYEAQGALFLRDWKKLEVALTDIVTEWDKAELPTEARPILPTIDQLKEVMRDVPTHAQIPKAVEVIYDLSVHRGSSGEFLLPDMAVATQSTLPELKDIEEPERPIDVGLQDSEGMSYHVRRNTKWGRPGATKPEAKTGIPVGYYEY